MRRRDALVLTGLVAGAIALPPILRRLPSEFQFEPIADFDGFRRFQGGAVSGVGDPFFGIGERLPSQAPLSEVSPTSPCQSLFADIPWTQTSLPVAIFTDFNCPYCKGLDKRLLDLREAGAPLAIRWRDMPLLGDGSMRAARAAVAARFLGVEEKARTFLWQSGMRPGPAAQKRMADHLEIDAALFSRETEGARVSQTIADDMTLGRRLGIPGTPGTVIGRTLVIGAIRDPDLRKLIKLEQSLPPLPC